MQNDHLTIIHDFTRRPFPGRISGLESSPDGLRPAHAAAGTAESDPISLPGPARELIMSWNAATPAGAVVEPGFAVGDAAGWSEWFTPGPWGLPGPRPRACSDPRFGSLHVDTLKSDTAFTKIRYKFTLRAASRPPALRLAALCVSAPVPAVPAAPPAGPPIELPVPRLSQFDKETVRDPAMMEAGVCAPTSLTMALRALGVRCSVYEIAKAARDETAGIYGNWSFLAAAAAEYGAAAWVERHSRWETLVRRLEQGITPIISVSFIKGAFSAFPERESAGHLMVLRGLTADGCFICNDPAVEGGGPDGAVLYPASELAAAFFGHGGVAIIVTRRNSAITGDFA